MNESDIAGTSAAMRAPTAVVSMKPVVLSAPGRGEDLAHGFDGESQSTGSN